MLSLKEELSERGLLYQNSNEDLFDIYEKGGESFYVGNDPTADSYHLGNFIGFMTGVHFMRRNNKFFSLIGGATGMVGDPGGKEDERTFLSEEVLEKNQKAVEKQIGGIFKNLSEITGESFDYEVVNNKDFYIGMGYIDFLRDVGKYITVNKMMSKDTVKKRIEDPNKSISYTEFSYMLIQGFDFLHLFLKEGIKLQMGGQDQWGNLVTGTEIIRKKLDKDSYVATWPLITDSTGKKFGKSEGNAIWLNKDKTSPYEIYQYFMNAEDNDIERYLKLLTLLELDYINETVNKHKESPELRHGQKILAHAVVEIIHGTDDANNSEKISELIFGKTSKTEILKNLDLNSLETFKKELGGYNINTEDSLFDILVKSGLAKNNTEARQLINSNAISINENKISDLKYDFTEDFLDNGSLLAQKGKKQFRIITK